MNKFLLSLVSVISSTAFAQETAVKQPEFWSPVVEHQIQRDIPQYLGYTDNAGLLMSTYDPNSVSSGYLGFLQSAEMISNLIFASIIAVAVLFAVFVLINGRAKLSDGFSGKLIQRWSVGDVVLHWCAAVPCIILILSGFVIGAGKVWLAPMMTPAHFHSLVYASVLFHNIFAIPFIIAAVILMVKWSGKPKHPDAGFANAGEKAFFWTFTIFGLALVVTGLLLLFPGLFGTLTKNGALLALIIHICSAIILGAFSVVHIYMGAVMSEGGMENMLSGKCDENWAKQNHNLWYAKIQGQNK